MTHVKNNPTNGDYQGGGIVAQGKLVGRRRVIVDTGIIASPAVFQGVASSGSTGRASHPSLSGFLSQNSSLQAGQWRDRVEQATGHGDQSHATLYVTKLVQLRPAFPLLDLLFLMYAREACLHYGCISL